MMVLTFKNPKASTSRTCALWIVLLILAAELLSIVQAWLGRYSFLSDRLHRRGCYGRSIQVVLLATQGEHHHVRWTTSSSKMNSHQNSENNRVNSNSSPGPGRHIKSKSSRRLQQIPPRPTSVSPSTSSTTRRRLPSSVVSDKMARNQLSDGGSWDETEKLIEIDSTMIDDDFMDKNPVSRITSQRGMVRKKDYQHAPHFDEQRIVNTYDIVFQSARGDGDDVIGCEYFGLCSGCSVDREVWKIPIVQSATRFFSSTAVQRKRFRPVSYTHTGSRMNTPTWVSENENPEEEDLDYPVVLPSPVRGWRTQAKLVAAPKEAESGNWSKKGGCVLGLYQRGTHQVQPIPNCAVHHPSINAAVHAIGEATIQANIMAYQETTREGALRYVQCQVERTSGKVCLTLVWNAESLKSAQPLLSRLVQALQVIAPTLWHSIWCHCNDRTGNNIFIQDNRRWYHISGPEFLRETLLDNGRKYDSPNIKSEWGYLYFTPHTFRQANLDGFQVLARDVAQLVPPGATVCELYAGVGLLGLTALAYHAVAAMTATGNRSNNRDRPTPQPLEWLRCSDENPANAICFRMAIQSMPATVTGDISTDRKKRYIPRTNREQPEKETGEEITLGQLAAMMASSDNKAGRNKQRSPQQRRSPSPKAKYMVSSASKALRAGQALGANVLIVDPPRRGLEPEVLEELCKPINQKQPVVDDMDLLLDYVQESQICWTNDVQILIYVSCGFDALARDSDQLLSSSAQWTLDSSTGYILFPGSDHVETVCVFRRK